MQNLPAQNFTFDNLETHKTRAETNQKALEALIPQSPNHASKDADMDEMHRKLDEYTQYVLKNCSEESFREAHLFFAETYVSCHHSVIGFLCQLFSLRFSMSHCLISDGLKHIGDTQQKIWTPEQKTLNNSERLSHINLAQIILSNGLHYFTKKDLSSVDRVKTAERLEKIVALISRYPAIPKVKRDLWDALEHFKGSLGSPGPKELIGRIKRMEDELSCTQPPH